MATFGSRRKLAIESPAVVSMRCAWVVCLCLALGCSGGNGSTPDSTLTEAEKAGGQATAMGTGGIAAQDNAMGTGGLADSQSSGGQTAGGLDTGASGGGASGAGTSGAMGAGGSDAQNSGGIASTSGGASDGGSSSNAGGLDASQIGAPVMISNAFSLAESPLWDPCNHQLLFTDVTASTIHALGADGQVNVYQSNTSNANGIAWDVDGSLILAQMGGSPGHIARLGKDGNIQVLEPPGSPVLHTPDDTIVRSDGTIYFTDGDFAPIGTLLGFAALLPIYMLKPGATSLVNVGFVSGPNGIEFSPDERTLYVSAYGAGTVNAFPVNGDGTLGTGSLAASGLINPDSLCLDAEGNLYVAVSTGIQVVRPDSSKVTLIPINSASGTTSCGFGGDDGKTLYISAWTSLWKVEGMPIPGQDWLVNEARLSCD